MVEEIAGGEARPAGRRAVGIARDDGAAVTVRLGAHSGSGRCVAGDVGPCNRASAIEADEPRAGVVRPDGLDALRTNRGRDVFEARILGGARRRRQASDRDGLRIWALVGDQQLVAGRHLRCVGLERNHAVGEALIAEPGDAGRSDWRSSLHPVLTRADRILVGACHSPKSNAGRVGAMRADT